MLIKLKTVNYTDCLFQLYQGEFHVTKSLKIQEKASKLIISSNYL